MTKTLANNPFSLSEITSAWLTDLLQERGHLNKSRVKNFHLEPNVKWNRAETAKISLQFEDAEETLPNRYFLKMAQPDLEFEDVVPGEFAFYNRYARQDMPIAKCYGLRRDEEANFDYFLLEDLSESHQQTPWPLPPSLPSCSAAVEALAKVHSCWWVGSERELQELRPSLAKAQKSLMSHVENFAPRFFDCLDDRLAPERKTILEATIKAFPLLMEKRTRSGGPFSLTHGDAHLWNLMFPIEGSERTCVFVDWEDWSFDVPAFDLAYMIALHWFPDRRKAHEQNLLEHYLDRLNCQGYCSNDLENDYTLGCLRNLLIVIIQQQIGVSPDVWWHHMERAFLAFEDLGCRRLLEV